MNQETTQIATDIIKVLNNPSLIQAMWQSDKLIDQIEKLCQRGITQNLFQFDGSIYCTICEEFLNDHSFKQLPCGHNAHIKCFKEAMLFQSNSLSVIELQYCCKAQPECRNETITEQMVIDFFGEEFVSEIRYKYKKQSEKSTLYKLPNCQQCQDILGQKFKQLFCGHFIHIECFQNYMLAKSPYLDIDDLRYSYCCSENNFCSQQVVTDAMLFEFFGKERVMRVREEHKEQERQMLKTQKEQEEKTCCTICKEKIENEKINLLICGHAIHKSCFRENMKKQSPGMQLGELQYCCKIESNCSNFSITEDMLLEFFEQSELQNIRDRYQQDLLLSKLLKEQEKQNIKEKEKAVTFDCGICFDKKSVESDAITLDCDHRFCKDCLKENIVSLVNQGKFMGKDIACPQCQRTIEPHIIQYCVPDQFNKIVELRMNNLVLATGVEGEKVVNCPARGCEKTFYIPYQMKFPECPYCKTKFCANGIFQLYLGCDSHHEGVQCKDYLLKVKANQKQGETKCPKCKVPIFKDGGCNHITCKCKYEFCFVCQGPYKPKKLCKCPQNGTADNFFGFIRRLNIFG